MTKRDFDAKLSSLNRKSTSNKTKRVLAENELKKLKTFGLSYFIGKSHFEEDGVQNYLVFLPLHKYFKVIASTNYVSLWQSKRLSGETIQPPAPADNSLNPKLSCYGAEARQGFRRSCLKQDKSTFNHKK